MKLSLEKIILMQVDEPN